MSVHSLKEMKTWQAMLALDAKAPFSVHQLAAATGRHAETLKPWLRRMQRAGFVRDEGLTDGHDANRSRGRTRLYRMITRPPRLPDIDRNGQRRPETNIQTMWRTMKMLKRFTIAELHAAVAEGRAITLSSAAVYVWQMKRAGVVSAVGPERRRNAATQFAVTGLVKGDLAPMVVGKVRVYDPNAEVMFDLKAAGGAHHG